jgi:hypothetical protein
MSGGAEQQGTNVMPEPETGVRVSAVADLHLPHVATPSEADALDFLEAIHRLVGSRLSVDGDMLVVNLRIDLEDGTSL